MGSKKQQPPGKRAARAIAPLPLPVPHDDYAAGVDIDEDDVAFVQTHRRQLQRLANAQLEEAPCVHAPQRQDARHFLPACDAACCLFACSGGKRRKKRKEEADVEEPYERVPRLGTEWEVRVACRLKAAQARTRLGVNVAVP